MQMPRKYAGGVGTVRWPRFRRPQTGAACASPCGSTAEDRSAHSAGKRGPCTAARGPPCARAPNPAASVARRAVHPAARSRPRVAVSFFFQRVDVPPFSLAETRAFLAAIEFTGDRAVLLGSARRLHRMAAGHPATLAALVGELGARVYDLANAGGRRLLALHARISHVETELAHAHS